MEDLDLGATLRGFTPGQKVFNRYKLTRILGRGGMGVVWLARDEELERDVALKFLPEIVALDPEALADLKRETRRNLELTHPHIVRIYDFVSDGRTAAISMEYVNGASLSALKLERPGRVFDPAELKPWVEQLCTALTYAHTRAKIVHRDLKPANLMVTTEGELKITDFGIARGISDSVSRVSAQLTGSSGTPVYMSPQQMMGDKPAVADDVYAVGATLYELLTGKPPFYSGNIILQVQNKAPDPINARRGEHGITGAPVPRAWEETIAACLAKEPGERPASMQELAARLMEKSGATGPAVSVGAPSAPVAAPPKLETPLPPKTQGGDGISGVRRWLLAPLLASLLPALAGVMFLITWRGTGGYLLYWPQLLREVGVVFLAGVLFAYAAFVAVLGVRRLFQGRVRPFLVGGGAVLGGLSAAGWVFLLAGNRAQWLADTVGHVLFREEIVLGGLFGILTGAVSGLILKRVAFGVPAGRPWLLAGGIAGGVFAGMAGFGFLLPHQFNRTLQDESSRQVQAWEETERSTREAAELEEKRRAQQHALVLEAARQQTAAQRAVREQEVLGLIREAHRMVFDRAPSQEVITHFTGLMLEDPSWDAARLRQELRSTPAGRDGGRLLVPEEFPTISAAVEAALPGNAVHVAPGTYREKIRIEQAIRLIGAGRDRVTVEVPADRNALQIIKADGVVVRGFTFRHTSTADTERRSYLVSFETSRVDFEDNAVLQGNGAGIGLGTDSKVNIRRTLVRGHRWAAISVLENASGLIADSVIENSQLGLSVRHTVRALEVTGSQFSGNQWQGLWLAEGDNITLTDNRISGNGTPGSNYGGLGVGKGRPVLQGNVSRDNIGPGIWWQETAQPVIRSGNLNDGTALAVTQ